MNIRYDSRSIVKAVAVFFAWFVGLLVARAETSEIEDSFAEGDLTGVFDFRTHRYDNGTDPYGWYEEDL